MEQAEEKIIVHYKSGVEERKQDGDNRKHGLTGNHHRVAQNVTLTINKSED